jgi:hypothetical protein
MIKASSFSIICSCIIILGHYRRRKVAIFFVFLDDNSVDVSLSSSRWPTKISKWTMSTGYCWDYL